MKPSSLAAYLIAPNICRNIRTTESETNAATFSRAQDVQGAGQVLSLLQRSVRFHRASGFLPPSRRCSLRVDATL
jgi:hypothetical protein